VQGDKSIQEKMRLFGEKVGIAFQIKDDLFDYGSDDNIGKPTGIDIKERKMTLPLIYALNMSKKSERKRIINIIKNHNENPKKSPRSYSICGQFKRLNLFYQNHAPIF